MIKNEHIYISHIYGCVSTILDYTQGMDELAFLNTKLVQDAVIRNLEVIGEATKRISTETREMYPTIEWKKWQA